MLISISSVSCNCERSIGAVQTDILVTGVTVETVAAVVDNRVGHCVDVMLAVGSH